MLSFFGGLVFGCTLWWAGLTIGEWQFWAILSAGFFMVACVLADERTI